MISKSVVFRNVIFYITISSRSFVFSQSRVEVSTSLSNVGGLAVRAFDLVNRSLSVVRFASVFNETSVTNNSSSQNYSHPDDHTIQTTDTPGFKPFTMLLDI